MSLIILKNVEKLHTGIVLLLDGQAETKLALADLTTIIREPQVETVSPPLSLLHITSMRDQVEITVSEGRLQLRDHSETKPGSDKFPKIVSGFAALLLQTGGARYRAFGWNFDVEFSVDEDELPARIICRKFINSEAIRSRTNLDIYGGGIRLFYQKGAQYTLHLEPRENKVDATRFFAHLNVHFQVSGALPNLDDLETSFKAEYETFVEMLSDMLT